MVVEIISSSRILFHKKLHDLIPPPPPRPVDTKLIWKYYDSTFFLFVGQFGASLPPPSPPSSIEIFTELQNIKAKFLSRMTRISYIDSFVHGRTYLVLSPCDDYPRKEPRELRQSQRFIQTSSRYIFVQLYRPVVPCIYTITCNTASQDGFHAALNNAYGIGLEQLKNCQVNVSLINV